MNLFFVAAGLALVTGVVSYLMPQRGDILGKIGGGLVNDAVTVVCVGLSVVFAAIGFVIGG